ncbi:nuclear transport factor 2 family protein [Actinacidiphila glaucinigra]|uniref:nuclear transport factor 2 family protein n=1 Tax=Actinacidiphila glaucinigra TaxID=235986 RepID=UPI0033E86AB7
MNDVERLTAIEELRRLMARYVRYADHKRWQDLASLFTPDGTFTPHKPDGSVWLRMKGRADIAVTIGGSNGPDDVLIHHLFSNEIDIQSATSARGTWSMEDIITRPDDVEVNPDFPFKGMHGYGHYHARFVKADGAWHIAELEQTRLRLDFSY